MRRICVALLVLALMITAFPALAQNGEAAAEATDSPVALLDQFRAATIAMMNREETDFNFQDHIIMPEDPEAQIRVMSAMFLMQFTMAVSPVPDEASEQADDMAVITMDPKPVPFVVKKVEGNWKIDMEATLDRMPKDVRAIAEPTDEMMEQARQRAQQSTCLSNLKQLGLAALMYAQDNDETLPDADKWVDQIMPYAKNEALFKCPAAPELDYGYAMNANLSGVKLAEVKSPADTVLFFDSTIGTKNAKCTGASLPEPPRHGDYNNFVFADGHYQARQATPNFDMAAEMPEGEVTHVTAETWEDEVIMQAGKVLVDFGADWCGPCVRLKPVYKKLAGEYEGVKFVSVDTDESPSLKDEYVEGGIPTLVMFENGEIVDKTVGFGGEQQLRDWLDGVLNQ